MIKTYTLSSGTTIKVHLQKKGESNNFFGDRNSWHDVYRLIMDFGYGKFTCTFHNATSCYKKPITESTIDNAVECVINDFSSYKQYPNIYDFLHEWGYDFDNKKQYNEGIKAYHGCCSVYKRLGLLTNEKELKELWDIINN